MDFNRTDIRAAMINAMANDAADTAREGKIKELFGLADADLSAEWFRTFTLFPSGLQSNAKQIIDTESMLDTDQTQHQYLLKVALHQLRSLTSNDCMYASEGGRTFSFDITDAIRQAHSPARSVTSVFTASDSEQLHR
jgi:hypothetical protein